MPKRSNLLLAAAAALLPAACGRGVPDGSVQVHEAWIRLPAAKDRPGAAYFRMEAGSEGTRLLSLTTPAARWVELHETKTDGGVMTMRRKREVEFPSDGQLAFEPGGGHAMLFGMDPDLKPGDKVSITFAFNVAPPVTVEAEVRSAAGEGHDG